MNPTRTRRRFHLRTGNGGKVTNAAVATRMRMAGDSFVVNLNAPPALAPGIYAVTAPGLGTLPLFIEGGAGMAHAVINRRLPA